MAQEDQERLTGRRLDYARGCRVRSPFAALVLVAVGLLPARCEGQDRVPVQLREVVRIGDVDGPAPLTSVGGLVVANGVLAVAQSMDGAVRLFTPDGDLIKTIGGKGEGPGEFRRVDYLGYVDDEWVVIDLGLRRLTFFTGSGDLIETAPLPQPRIRPPALWIGRPWAAQGRRVVLSASVPYDELDRLPVVLVGRQGTVLDTLTWFDPRPLAFRIEYGDGRRTGGPHPITRELLGVSPDGATFAEIAGDSSGLVLSWHDLATGRTVRQSLPIHPVKVRRAWAEQARDSILALYRGYGLPVTSRDVREGIPFPEEIPGADVIQPVRGGRAWIREAAVGGSSRNWRLVAQESGEVLRTTLPARVRIYDQAGDTVWATDVDELGVHHVVGLVIVR